MKRRVGIAGPTLRERWLAGQPLAPLGLAIAAALLSCGCATRPLLERALAARGGPLHGVVLDAAARVYSGAPGRWRYARVYLSPGLYAWRIETAGEPDTYIFDGGAVRAYIGAAATSVDASPTAPLRSHARWTAVSLLDGLTAPDVSVAELPADEVPAGAREGLRVTFADGGTYRLGFDRRALLTSIDGPLDLSPLASGPASARYDDPRRVGGVTLPFRATYFAGGQRVAEEAIQAACVNPPALTPAAFTAPERLPTCDGGR
ncbi:hypothetical protein KF840_01375 [bacterium]|nr:hypothetical protein [bacterium]